MTKNKDQGHSDLFGEAVGPGGSVNVCETPCQRCKQKEEGKKVSKGGVGSVPSVFCFWVWSGSKIC